MTTRIVQLRGSSAMLGAERVVLELARHTREFGVESIIVAPHDEGAPEPELVAAARTAGIQTEILPCRGRLDRSLFKRIRQLLRREHVDLLHCHGYKEDFYGLLSSPGLPRVATNHLWKRTTRALRAYCWLDARLIRHFDQVVAVSEPIFRELQQVGVPAHKLSRIANGIDMAPFRQAQALSPRDIRRELGLPEDAVVIGMVSSLTTEKGHRFALEALAQNAAAHPQVRLAIVGDGPERAAIQAQAQRLGLEQRVILCGRRGDIPRVLRALDLFLLPSLVEGLPMALLEAMAAGLPVVASSVGDVPTAVRDRETGRLVAPADVSGLAAALSDLLADPTERSRLGAAARRLVEAQFSSREMARQYCQLYERLLAASPAARRQAV